MPPPGTPSELSIVDTVRLPADLAAGHYILGWRWDCEETAQVTTFAGHHTAWCHIAWCHIAWHHIACHHCMVPLRCACMITNETAQVWSACADIEITAA
jgi:hypothetical protein